MQNPNISPVNPLPPVVVALFLFMAGLEGLFLVGERGLAGAQAVGWRLQAVQDYAFSGDIFDWMLRNNVWPLEHLIRFVTYPFVHTHFVHALFSGVMLLALGKIVGEVLGGWRTLAVFVLSGIGGAFVYGALLNDSVPLVGAFPPIYGLIGAFTYMLWLRLGQLGEQQIRAFSLIGFLLALQLLFGVLFGGGLDWVADVAAFVFGFALAIVLTPGGWQSILERIRRP